jgi:hypothetical protein
VIAMFAGLYPSSHVLLCKTPAGMGLARLSQDEYDKCVLNKGLVPA